MGDELAPEGSHPGAAPPLAVSVIVPTRNRRRLLQEVIGALWAQTVPPDRFEIIVVDNCSTDGTPELMAELIARSPCRLVYQVMPENRGPARSRNTGARLARGEILAFTDDDCRPTPEWLASGLAGFRAGVGLVTGRVLYKPEQIAGAGFFSRDTGLVLEEHPTYTWSNSLYRRDPFLELDGTDETLCRPDLLDRVVDCGDTDLAWRVKKRGWANVFAPEALVYHELQQMTPLRWLLEPLRLFVLPQLVQRHPELRRHLLHGRVFFLRESAWFYLAALSVPLASLWHWGLLALAAPYLAWCLRFLRRSLTNPAGWPKIPLQAALLAARQAVLCAALVYGSIRFRTLVL